MTIKKPEPDVKRAQRLYSFTMWGTGSGTGVNSR